MATREHGKLASRNRILLQPPLRVATFGPVAIFGIYRPSYFRMEASAMLSRQPDSTRASLVFAQFDRHVLAGPHVSPTAVEAKGTPAELAELAWKAALNGEPWAIQMIFNRLEPQTTQLKLTHEKSDGPTIDYSRLIDSEVEGLESLLERATGAIAELEDGEGAPTAA